MRASRAHLEKGVRNKTRSTTLIEIVKQPSDVRAYRVVILPNGITTMLISDGLDAENYDVESMDVDFDEGEAAAALCIGVGSFSDLPEIPGFAHFMEHMVFMGSKKYPKENYFDEFIANNGGESNAWTDCERTCFYFVCSQNSFTTALEIFAQFFISPIFNKQSVDREIMAVDSEWRMRSSNDIERMRNIISYEIVEVGHPMGKFMAGNVKSLKENPEKNNVNVYEQLHSFFQRMYSAHYMTLVVHSMETLDIMEEIIIKIFTKVNNNGIPRPKFIKPPFQERKLNKLIRVIPMSEIHKMEIIWALPPLMEHYRARVLPFLTLLLVQESKGSILYFLRKNHLALDIKGGNDYAGFTHNSTWSAFILSIKLTELGADNYNEVLKTVFQYIDLIKKNLPTHLFEEQKHIQETRFIFKEQEPIFNFVQKIAENMHMFPPEHYLCGRKLYFEYNEQLIRDCLDFLRPQGMLLMLFSKQFINIPTLTEVPWLPVKYKVDDIDSNMINRLTNLEPNPELLLPAPNPYIVSNFNLLEGVKSTKGRLTDASVACWLVTQNPDPSLQSKVTAHHIAAKIFLFPIVVMNEDGCRMWYKKDNKYDIPNAFIYLNFISSVISRTAQNIVLSDIFMTMIQPKLKETLYNSILAGFEYSVDAAPEGVIFILEGYSEKIKLVTQDAVNVFLDLKVSDDSFTSAIAHLKQVYINELLKPVDLARAVRCSLLEVKNSSDLERYQQISSISYELLLSFIQEFYSHLFVEGFVTGNLKAEDAVDIGHMVQTLVMKPLPETDFPKPCMMVLPVGDCKCFVSAINKEDTNSCVVHYFQQGLGTVYDACLNEMLGVVMNEPLFNMLRTEYQLGYSVYCQPVTSYGVIGFIIVVESQANKFSMKLIDELMEKFLNNFPKILEDISQAQFNDMVNNQSLIEYADDADMQDESQRFWQEIVNQNYVFDRLKLQRNAMNKITKGALIDWCKTLISDKKRKLTLMKQFKLLHFVDIWIYFLNIINSGVGDMHEVIEGHCKEKPELINTQSDIKSIRNLLKNFNLGNTIPNFQKIQQLPAPPVEESLIQFRDLGPTYITNIGAFKNLLKEYPYHVIMK